MIPALSDITGADLGYDLETRDNTIGTLGPGWAFNEQGYPIGYALAWFNGDLKSLSRAELKDPSIEARFGSVYLPIRHEGGDNLPMDQVRGLIAPLLLDPRRNMVGANIIYDYGWTLFDGFEWKADLDDVQIQGPLLDDNRRSYSLDNMLKDYLGVQKDEAGLHAAAKQFGLTDVKGQLWKLPGSMVSDYAKADARRTLWLWALLQHDMVERELEVVHRLERDLVPVLYHMRKRGVRIDQDRIAQIRSTLVRKETEADAELKASTDHHIDIWAAATIIPALKAEGLTDDDFPRTEKEQELSVNNVLLKSLAAKDNRAGAIARGLLKARRYNKARSTFVDSTIIAHMVDGRIHGEMRALRGDDGGTVSGRLSGAKPSLQVIPARDPELGPMIRSAFAAEEGECWAALDYSSQEPRLATHFGVLAQIAGAEFLKQMWIDNPRADAYQATADICGIARKDAKTIRLGILYGMGGGKLCFSLGLPYKTKMWKGKETMVAGPEGEDLLDRFDRASPMDRRLSKLAKSVATSRGYVKTILGRRAYFPRQANGQVWFTHKALNRIIQGSAADMTKTAMVNCFRAGHTPLVSLHDELGFSVSSDEQVAEIRELMENAIPLEVPSVCDVETGRSWGESMVGSDDEIQEWLD